MLFIKSFGFFRNRVHQDRAYTNQRCGIDYTQDRIVQEIGAKSLALPSAIDREPSEQHNWNGIGHVTSNPWHCSTTKHRSCCQTVIADNTMPARSHERARGAVGFIGAGAALHPIVERSDTGVEGIEIVVRRERLGS